MRSILRGSKLSYRFVGSYAIYQVLRYDLCSIETVSWRLISDKLHYHVTMVHPKYERGRRADFQTYI